MIINHACVITCDETHRIINDGYVRISDGVINEVGKSQDLKNLPLEEEIIDAKGIILMPSSICAHTHFYGAFSRGLYIPGDAPDAFPNILKNLWWKLDKSLNKDAVYLSALVCLIDAIKHGTAILFDHHASPSFIENSLDAIANAVLESKLKVSLCYEVTDRNGIEETNLGIKENLRFIDRIKSERSISSNISAMFGLHASLTLSDKTLDHVSKVCPSDTGFHIHVAEHSIDEYDSLKKSGLRVVERLAKFGILGPKTILVHCVHIDAKEISLIAENHSFVTHQPRSNMNNAVGLPEVESMNHSGIKVCLGNDGFSNSMWQEWSSAYLGHKLLHRDPRRMPADLIYQMAIENNRSLANQQFGSEETGIIKKGAAADLILVDYEPFTELNKENLPWHIVFGFRESMIKMTMVNGEILMKDGALVHIDEQVIIKEAQKVSQSVWKAYHKTF